MLDKAAQQKYKKWLNKYGQKNESYVYIFHRNRNKFTHKDIYRYSLEDLKKEIIDKNIESNRKLKQNGSEKLLQYEDTCTIQLVRLDSYEAIKKYLSNTKLCITNKRNAYEYICNGDIFYSVIINSTYFNEKYTIIADIKRKHIQKYYYNKFDDLIYDELSEHIMQAVREDFDKLNSSNNWFLYLRDNDAPINEKLYKQTLQYVPCGVFHWSITKTLKSKFASKHVDYILDPNITDNITKNKLINYFNMKTLAKHLDVPECQVRFAQFCPAKDINKLDLSNKNVKVILKDRAKNVSSIKNKCVKLGIIKEDVKKKNKNIEARVKELEAELKKLKKEEKRARQHA